MEVPSSQTTATQLAHAGKLITDLDELLQIMLRQPRQAKPWQRQLVTLLREAERNVQVLRMTISLERAPAEILDACETLRATSRKMIVSMSHSRADLTTLQAVQLLAQMSDAIDRALKALNPLFPPAASPAM